jgi:hypothetical protein
MATLIIAPRRGLSRLRRIRPIQQILSPAAPRAVSCLPAAVVREARHG